MVFLVAFFAAFLAGAFLAADRLAAALVARDEEVAFAAFFFVTFLAAGRLRAFFAGFFVATVVLLLVGFASRADSSATDGSS